MRTLLHKLAQLLAFVATTYATTSWIVPGAVWTDTAGVRIDAHGGMIIKPGNVWYWVGQGDSSSVSPRIYGSEDLLNWYDYGLANSAVTYMYRPKLFVSGGRFQIWGQIDRYTQGMTSTEISGGYSTYGSLMSIPPDGWDFSDCGVFIDDDGSAYWVTSATSNNIAINLINPGTSPTIGTRIAAIENGALEAPALFKAGGIYFLIVSAKTGYTANPNKLYWATTLAGPWTGGTDIAPESTNTYNSQSTFVYTLVGTTQTTYIFMGDAWDSAGDASSNYEWLPLSVNVAARTATLQDYAYWKVNPTTGVVTTSSTGKRYEAEDAILTGRAAVTDCEKCISKRSVHRIDSGSNVTFTGIEGLLADEKQWISLHYTVNNATAGDAHVYVNDAKLRVRDLNTRAGRHSTVPIAVNLRPGPTNTIVFSTEGQDFEAHLDGIEVFDGTEEEIEVQV